MNNIYTPIGTFSDKKKEIEIKTFVIIPILVSSESDKKKNYRKIELQKRFTLSGKSENYKVVLLVVSAKKLKFGTNETEEDIDENLKEINSKAEEGKNLIDCTNFKINVTKEEFGISEDDIVEEVLLVIFHSDQDKTEIKDCFEKWLSTNTEQVFEKFYENNCKSKGMIAQPETSGQSILVGT